MNIEFMDVLVDTAAVAKALCVSQKRLRAAACKGTGPLPIVRVGRSVRYRRSDLEKFIKDGGHLPMKEKRGPGRPRKKGNQG